MLKRLLLTATVAGIVVGLGIAQQPSRIVNIPVPRTPADSGKAMYTNFCAPCHGVDGRGDGPVAGSLNQAPTDLTILAKSNQGKYPMNHVLAVLNFGVVTPAHGTGDMPVWGLTLTHVNGPSDVSAGQERALRINNLAKYVETLQAK